MALKFTKVLASKADMRLRTGVKTGSSACSQGGGPGSTIPTVSSFC